MKTLRLSSCLEDYDELLHTTKCFLEKLFFIPFCRKNQLLHTEHMH